MKNRTREEYIRILNSALAPLKLFGSIHYMTDNNTGAEYIMLADSIGNSHFMNITGFDDEHMLLDIIAVAIGNTPASVINDINKRMILAEKFKRS